MNNVESGRGPACGELRRGDLDDGQVLSSLQMRDDEFETNSASPLRGRTAIDPTGEILSEKVFAISFWTTSTAVFPHVLCVQSGVADELQDLYLFASTEPLAVPNQPELRDWGWLGNETFEPEWEEGVLLTDDRNPIDRLHAPLALALRRAQRR